MEGQWPVGRGGKDRGTSVHTDSMVQWDSGRKLSPEETLL